MPRGVTYRMQTLWLHNVRTPNELPSQLSAYRTQQYRWSAGPTQVRYRCTIGMIR